MPDLVLGKLTASMGSDHWTPGSVMVRAQEGGA